jgi:tetratricopeptide (TPR) repeat protein
MNDKKVAAQSQGEVEKGLKALKQGDKDTASKHFWNALDCLADVQDDRMRRDELRPLASGYFEMGLLDLAIMAATEAIALDTKLKEPRQQAKNLITRGNAYMNLGRLEEAIKDFSKTLKLCLDNEDYANAAAASTNIATIKATQDKMTEALKLLRNSLGYLEKEPHPDTEKITRLMLVQVLGLTKKKPKELIDVAETLLDRFAHEIAPEHMNVISGYIDDAVQQYLKKKSKSDRQKWKMEHFPLLYQ